jgi:ribonucleoside-diphosphate reductase alpha chain
MLSEVAAGIFKTLYSYNGENIEDTFKRVSTVFGNEDCQTLAFHYLINNVWRPNTPVFFNAGKKKQIMSACWVVDLQDSMDSIYDICNVARKIFQSGAGIGIPIGNLREKEALIFEKGDGYDNFLEVKRYISEYPDPNVVVEIQPEGKSSGPINFMKLYDAAGDTTKSGGRARRAAILCTMPIWHPDIEDFISCKRVDGTYSNMNISVGITDKFMECLKDGIPYVIHTPYDGSLKGHKDSKLIWQKIAEYAHDTADPGVLFLDTINKNNPLKSKILIQTTNPCGEQPLRPWECCNLSAINIAKFVKTDHTFDWDGLFEIAMNCTEMMDNLIDVMDYPDERFAKRTQETRPIGLGVMGLADALFLLDLKYNSKEGQAFAGRVMKTITHGGFHKSAMLAMEKGAFPLYEDKQVKADMLEIITKHIGGLEYENTLVDEGITKTLEMVKQYGVRNCQISTCAPTGTTALSCDCSYGIEPCFGLVFQKNFSDGRKTKIVNEIFRSKFKNEAWFTDDILDKIIANGGTLKNVRGIPKEVKEVFVVAHDIKYRDRVDMQAAIQKYCSTAISSTVNLPESTTVEEIMELYQYAYEKDLKGITIYRDKCKKNQPVTFTEDKKENNKTSRPKIIFGATHQIELPDGDMLVTVNKIGDKVGEIIIEQDNTDAEVQALLEFAGKIASKALRHGMPLEDVVKQGKGIMGNTMAWIKFLDTDAKATQIKSKPDCLAKLLQRFYVEGGLKVQETLGMSICPKCHNETLAYSEGCNNCVICGYNACGEK